MKKGTNGWLAAVAAMAVGAAVMALVRPGGVEGGGPPRGFSFPLTPRPAEAEVLARRIEAKTQVTDRLLDGEMSLVQAAAWFRHLDAQPPVRACDDGSAVGEGERLCRQVIGWATWRLPDRGASPSQAAQAVRRLEAELRVQLTAGPLELPW